MDTAVLAENIQQYLRKHLSTTVAEFALQKHPFPIANTLLCEQLKGLQIAQKKHPNWFDTPGIYYPKKINLEQSSSEQTAQYKAFLIGEIHSFADLTGGMGIDSFYLGKDIQEAHYVELSADLCTNAQHNFKLLKAEQIQVHNQKSEDFLGELTQPLDCIYLDPDRRHQSKGKVVLIEDLSPNLLEIKELLLEKAQQVLVKMSPLLDIKKTLKDLSNTQEVHVLALKNEVKELLFVLGKETVKNPIIKAINLSKKTPEFTSVFSFDYATEITTRSTLSEPLTYLYEPNAAILKAGAFKSIAKSYHLSKLDVNSHFYTSKELISDFPGKIIQIEKEIPAKEVPKGEFILWLRNYPLKLAAIKKKYNLKEGGEKHLIFTTALQKPLILLGKRISL